MSRAEAARTRGQSERSDLLERLSRLAEGLSTEEIAGLVTTLEGSHGTAGAPAEDDLRVRRSFNPESLRGGQPLDYNGPWRGPSPKPSAHAESAEEGLIMSLALTGHVDVEFISQAASLEPQAVVDSLRGRIYQNPLTWGGDPWLGWETAEQYLFGDVPGKLDAAKDAASRAPQFQANVQALEGLLPEPTPHENVHVGLGSPWLPEELVDDFIVHLLGEARPFRIWNSETCHCEENVPLTRQARAVRHDPLTGSWEIPDQGRYQGSIAETRTWGTPRMGALAILERTLNLRDVEVKTPGSSSVDAEETQAALEKQRAMQEEFKAWLWKDPERAALVEKAFLRSLGSARRPRYDGTALAFSGMSPEIHLRRYRKDAVARMLLSPNVLLAHDVGAGKTYTMAAAAMEMRRMGTAKKPMFVVPNPIIGQWEAAFRTLYPDAKVPSVDPELFRPDVRRETLEQVRSGDWDAVLIAYSSFERLPVSQRERRAQLTATREAVARAMKGGLRTDTRSLRRLAATVDRALARLSETSDGLCFDDLGVDRLFVDEAHNYKNLPFKTKMDNVLGLHPKGSRRCQDMLEKVRAVQRANGGGGVVMATATPITNSVADLYAFQRYLQPGELELRGLGSFDAWAGAFAEKDTAYEVDVDGVAYRPTTRLSQFCNLPELSSLVSLMADFHEAETPGGLPAMEGRENVTVQASDELKAYLENLSDRAERVRAGAVDPRRDNMLKITTDGRKAALDVRLVSSAASSATGSKVERCARRAYEIWEQTQAWRGVQLVFCDISTPKQDFNVYEELRSLLVGLGLPGDQVAFAQGAKGRAREDVLRRARAGDLRVLIGSTQTLGTGTNVQDRVVAVHHLDVPWRPSDMTQREGRMLRPGNRWERVRIYRYVTEGSFDAYSWQLLETKQRFVSQLLDGTLGLRESADVGPSALDYGELKGLAVGEPLLKERLRTANELARLTAAQRRQREDREAIAEELLGLPSRIEAQEGIVVVRRAKFDAALCIGSRREVAETGKLLTEAEAELGRLRRRQQEAKVELSKGQDCGASIERCKQRLAELDKKLGLKRGSS